MYINIRIVWCIYQSLINAFHQAYDETMYYLIKRKDELM